MYLSLCANCHYELAPTIARDTSHPIGDCNACTARSCYVTQVHITEINL